MKNVESRVVSDKSKKAAANRARPQREQDFYAWLIDQADLLRTHRPAFADWAGIAEELEAMGASEKRELKSRLIVLTAHLLKCKYASQQRKAHQNCWRETIREQRRALNDLLAENPSLKQIPQTVISDTDLYREHIRADAIDDTGLDTFPHECPWSIDSILSPSFLARTIITTCCDSLCAKLPDRQNRLRGYAALSRLV